MDGADFSRLDFGFLLISFKKLFYPEFDLLNSGCGLSAGAAYLRVRLICGFLRYFVQESRGSLGADYFLHSHDV